MMSVAANDGRQMTEDHNKGGSQLLKSSFIVSGMTMVSRVLGLARDMVIAYFFGAAAGSDAFAATIVV